VKSDDVQDTTPRGRGVLVIDDTDVIRRHAVDFLKSQNVFDRYFEASDGIAGLKILIEDYHQIDLVLCDLEMPGIDGFKFLDIKHKTKTEFDEIPVIILTSRGEVEKKVTGLDLGASDYLVKPVDDGELLARVRVQLKIKHLQDQLRKKNNELERLSNTDSLTGMYNRRHFMQLLSKEFERALRHDAPLAFIMIDIDHFKRVNDELGHQAGDIILCHVADLLQRGLRAGDVVGRYGGEEFAMLLPQTNLEGAVTAAERYRKLIESTKAPNGGQVTISLGVSWNGIQGIRSVDDLMRTADAALYEAKHQGRNRTVKYSSPAALS
jgi:diguanylate cyclase (GGDEF)-like protein